LDDGSCYWGAGYIGSHTVLALLEAGEKIVVLDDLSTGFRWAVMPPAKLIVGEVGNSALVDEILTQYRIDAIVHFAGKIVVPESITDPLAYYLDNTAKTRSLLESAIREKVKQFIYSSTAAVYGEATQSPIGERAPLAPVNPYGRSKLASEWMLQDVSRAHGLKFAILRYFNVAGADPKRRLGQSAAQATHLIKIATQTAIGLRPRLEIFGTDYPTRDGTCIRDYVQVTDLADAHVLALNYLRYDSESLICNCGCGHGLSVFELVHEMKKVSGIDFDVRISDRRPGDSVSLVADPACIGSLLAWKPKWDDLTAIVSQALDWENRLQQTPDAKHHRAR